jgi:hypothetical protein
MIVTRLCGGLGNQMFQYAAGRGLARARGEPLVLDLDWYHRSHASTAARAYELHQYPIMARVASTAERLSYRLRASRFGARCAWLQRGWTVCREASFDYDPSVRHLRGRVYLDGYWQSPRYFEDGADAIRAELTSPRPLGAHDVKVLDLIRHGPSVSVHVRRADYVTNASAAELLGTCAPDYYERACDVVASRVPGIRFFVFSDDVNWSRTALRFPGPTTFVGHNGPDTAFQDLRLMSLCDHHVIANSSFSWWGAWLDPKPRQVVVAPCRWFADGRPTATLMPENWIRL